MVRGDDPFEMGDNLSTINLGFSPLSSCSVPPSPFPDPVLDDDGDDGEDDLFFDVGALDNR